MSLKVKFLLTLVLVTALCSITLIYLATQIFKQDKTVHLFDSSITLARNLSSRIESEVASRLFTAQAVVSGYQRGIGFSDQSRRLFEASQLPLLALIQREGSDWQKSSDLRHLPHEVLPLPDRDLKVIAESGGMKLSLYELQGETFLSVLSPISRDSTAVGAGGRVLWLLLPMRPIATILADSGAFSSMLIEPQQIQLIEANLLHPLAKSVLENPDLLQSLQSPALEEGAVEITAAGEPYLISYASTSFGLPIVTAIPSAVAFQSIGVLISQTTYLLVALLFLAVAIGVWFANRLTSTLKLLAEATRDVSRGEFGILVPVKSRDEVGLLSKAFNSMSQEIQRLLIETASKARMESELATAKTVQDTLFPEGYKNYPEVEVAGSYRSASECGGDWWFHYETPSHIYIIIADATGHGVPAALLTSAARAATSVIERQPDLSLSEHIASLNRAIFDTAKGERMMTAFIAAIDRRTLIMKYVNASHMAAVRLTADFPEKAKWRHLDFIQEPVGPRLGQDKNSQYKEGEVQLYPEDLLLFLTDGATEMQNPEGKELGERSVFQVLANYASEASSQERRATDLLAKIHAQLESHRQGAELADDVTVITARLNLT